MAKKLVDYYDFDYARQLAKKFVLVDESFNDKVFLEYISSRLSSESFLARQDIYVEAIEHTMGSDYKNNLQIFKAIWGDELKQETGMFKYGWWLWPIGR